MSSEDSSSSDEDTELNERLKEAASVQLISCMDSSEKPEMQLKDNKERKANVGPLKKLKSIREKVYGEPVAEDNALNTTPEFRLHVSKKLGKYIDGNIELFQPKKSTSQRIEFDKDGGVKLLSNSINFLKDSNTIICPNKRRRPARKVSETSSSEEETDKLNSVAVSGMEILQNGQGAFKLKNDQQYT